MFDKIKVEELYPQAGDLMWEPMLMWKLPDNKKHMFEEVCSNGKYFASIKKDGACYQFVKTQNYSYLFGRTVSRTTGLLTEKIANVPHIEQALNILPPRTVIVVEIYYPGKTSRDTTTIMGCLPQLAIKRQENNPIHAYAHDILYYDGIDLRNTGALNRYKILAAIWEKHNLSKFSFLELAQPIYEDIFEACNNALANGEEGLVLRKKDAPWVVNKRPAWSTIKMKKNDTIDLVCMGFCDATKEYTGTGKELNTWKYWEYKGTYVSYPPDIEIPEMLDDETYGEYKVKLKKALGDWIPLTKGYYYGWKTAMKIGAYDENGKLIEVGTVSSGLTDEDCEKMATHPEDYLDHVFRFNCMSIDKENHTLRHPALIGRRDDKNAKDCTIKEEFS